jgi:hypothetical protein
MFALTNKPEMGARLYSGIVELAYDPARGTDGMKVIQHIAGVLCETYLLFEDPAEAMADSFVRLQELLGSEAVRGEISIEALPPAHIIDFETERGRRAARLLFEEWLDCEYEFHSMILTVVQGIVTRWEEQGIHRAESLRLIMDCTKLALGFEIAAQELCDVVIEQKVSQEGWSLGDCIASLSAIAGRRLALSLSNDTCIIFRGSDIPDNLDHVAAVMTQEAVRLGVPAGSDWRFGLAANDMPLNPPMELVRGIEPCCVSFFAAMNVEPRYVQAIACAKAAGRMVAVAAGGELPELEPAIAKPLAMAAMTETYKYVCMDQELRAY